MGVVLLTGAGVTFVLGPWIMPHPPMVIAYALLVSVGLILGMAGRWLWRIGTRLIYAPIEGVKPLPRIRLSRKV